MHTFENKTAKHPYIVPKIERIKLDNEISLQLESNAPVGPGESGYAPEHFNNDPFKTNIG
ncbi:MAG: hypothetical protein LLF95_01880 [Bacteroidales bacterium]|nr:hypothetical protein [Bacteroidales bacterium]